MAGWQQRRCLLGPLNSLRCSSRCVRCAALADRTKKVTKKGIYRALIIGTRQPVGRLDGTSVQTGRTEEAAAAVDVCRCTAAASDVPRVLALCFAVSSLVSYIKMATNRCLILDRTTEKFVGSRVDGPICKELRANKQKEIKYKQIISFSGGAL